MDWSKKIQKIFDEIGEDENTIKIMLSDKDGYLCDYTFADFYKVISMHAKNLKKNAKKIERLQ